MAYCHICFTTTSVLLSLSLDYVHLQVRTQFAQPRLPLNHEFRTTLLPYDPASVPLTLWHQFEQHMTTTIMMVPNTSYGASQRTSACQSPWKISLARPHSHLSRSWYSSMVVSSNNMLILGMFERPKSVTTRVTLGISNELWLHHWHPSSNDFAVLWISSFSQIFCCCCLVAGTPIYIPSTTILALCCWLRWFPW